MNFFAELKCQYLFRAAAFYAAVIGFPSLALSWFYE